MVVRGSQRRCTLEEEDVTFVSLNDADLLVRDVENQTLSLYVENDDFAGFVLEYNERVMNSFAQSILRTNGSLSDPNGHRLRGCNINP